MLDVKIKKLHRDAIIPSYAKELRIKEVANKWKDQIDPRAYEALINYQVEITD